MHPGSRKWSPRVPGSLGGEAGESDGFIGNVVPEPRAILAVRKETGGFAYDNPFHIVQGMVVFNVMISKFGCIPEAHNSASMFTYACANSPCSHANIFELARAFDHMNHILAVTVGECSYFPGRL
ncbi:hypothetical protein NDU88_003880 [Pleurodeles waltl]|uniref:Uncharacterized protein n=1 Tax=Pleurodeles waltl TaxID=8319 RepID=A0AAV7UEX8_PLEWA|nr:hypothetical protein NDU88_003880 [Pleurodeles waltl]